MDWVITFLVLVLVVYMVLLMRQLDDLRAKQSAILAQLDQFRTRQSAIAQHRNAQRGPPVDVRAKTSRRDSDDLPVTGHMTTALHREKRVYERTDADH